MYEEDLKEIKAKLREERSRSHYCKFCSKNRAIPLIHKVNGDEYLYCNYCGKLYLIKRKEGE